MVLEVPAKQQQPLAAKEPMMSRTVRIAAAQLGPIARSDPREAVVDRLITLLHKAHSFGANLVVYPEAALTTFFPRWVFDDPSEAETFFETAMPNASVQPLFDEARRLRIGFCLGYAELTHEEGRKRRFNTCVLVNADGDIVGKYRKVHIPGLAHADPDGCTTNFEKRYFENGNLGFPVFRAFGGVMGMCICNDRRWPETYRVMGLQGAELIMVGYNTGSTRMVMQGNHRVMEPAHLASEHNLLVMRAGAYQNCCWVVGVAKAGTEETCEFLGQSCIIAPTGDVVALAATLGDEVIVADCDLSAGDYNRRTIFDFGANRQLQHYGLISSQKGVVVPV
jgi:predicted amidohydrolase